MASAVPVQCPDGNFRLCSSCFSAHIRPVANPADLQMQPEPDAVPLLPPSPEPTPRWILTWSSWPVPALYPSPQTSASDWLKHSPLPHVFLLRARSSGWAVRPASFMGCSLPAPGCPLAGLPATVFLAHTPGSSLSLMSSRSISARHWVPYSSLFLGLPLSTISYLLQTSSKHYLSHEAYRDQTTHKQSPEPPSLRSIPPPPSQSSL